MINILNLNEMIKIGIVTVSIGFFSTMLFIFKVKLKNKLSNNEKTVNKTIKSKKDYYYKYKDLFNKLEENKDLDKLDFNFLFIKEIIDKKEIIMGYNKIRECFDVWYDEDKLNYIELDTISQLFAIEFNCKNICVNYQEEYYKEKEKVIQQITKEKSDKHLTKKNSVGAEFKRYNTKKKNDLQKIIPENANNFRKCGDIELWVSLYEKYGTWEKCKNNESSYIWEKKTDKIDKPEINIS